MASVFAWPGVRGGADGEGYLVDRRAFHHREPIAGEWAWIDPGDGQAPGVARVLATRGHTVSWADDQLRVDGRPAPFPIAESVAPPIALTFEVPSGYVLMTGAGSSRSGASPGSSLGLRLVAREEIVGRAWARLYPVWNRASSPESKAIRRIAKSPSGVRSGCHWLCQCRTTSRHWQSQWHPKAPPDWAEARPCKPTIEAFRQPARLGAASPLKFPDLVPHPPRRLSDVVFRGGHLPLETRPRSRQRCSPSPSNPPCAAINRANALRSTGPKTAEGKDASRRNALKHGMCARTLVLPDEEQDAIDRRVAEYTPCLRPADAFETLAGRGDRRQRRAREALPGARGDHPHAAGTARDPLLGRGPRAAGRRMGARLPKAPESPPGGFARSKQGCTWLIERWEALGHALESKATGTSRKREWPSISSAAAAETRPRRRRSTATLRPADRSSPSKSAGCNTLKSEVLETLDDEERDGAEVGCGPELDRELKLARRYENASRKQFQWAHRTLIEGRNPSKSTPRIGLIADEPEPEGFGRGPETPLASRVAHEAGMSRLVEEIARQEAILDARESRDPSPREEPAGAWTPPVSYGGNRKHRRAQKALARRNR